MDASLEPLSSQCLKSRRVWIIIAISIAGALSVIFSEITSQLSHDVYDDQQSQSEQSPQSQSPQSAKSPQSQSPQSPQSPILNNTKATSAPQMEEIVSPVSPASSFMNAYMNSPPFTQCELKYLGWNSYGKSGHDWGDFSFSDNQLTIICKNEDYETDKHHAHIECYNTKWKNRANICIMKNVYAYMDGSKLKYKAFCKEKLNDKAKAMKKKLSATYKKFMPVEFIENTFDTNDNDIIDMDKLNNNDVWFYDNSDQCESAKKGDKNHVGNPWHCFGHVETWYHIAHRLSISRDTHNTTIIMTDYREDQFGVNIPIFHFHTPFFHNYINDDIAKETLKDGKLHYVKEFIMDERSHQGFGCSSIWFHKVLGFIDDDKSCKNKDLSRSPIYIEMKTLMTSFYESVTFYADYDWIEEIHNIQEEKNKFQVYGNLTNDIENGNNTQWIFFIASRWINGVCRYRCIKNIEKLKDGFVDLFHNKWNMDNVIIVFGNPGAISFRAQMHLFKNSKVFVGVHGAVFLMAALFMEPDAYKYEIRMPHAAKSDHIVRMFGDGIHKVYDSFYCDYCKVKRTDGPSDIEVDKMIDKFSKDFKESYSELM